MENGIQKAVRLMGGNQSALARLCNRTPQAVQKWLKQGYVPSDLCREVEAALDNKVTRYELNPETFGPAPEPIIERRKTKRSAHP